MWDTVLAMVGLADAGLPPDHPALVKAATWVLDEEIQQRGDWQVRRPHTPAGGWAFEFDNDNYADTDDTAEVILALRRTNDRQPRGDRQRPALARGHAVQGRRLGRVRRGQHPRAGQQAAVLRLRRGHRPAERGRHRAHRRGVRGRRARQRDRLPPRRDLAAEEPGERRVLVRPLGRELHLRHRRGRARADRRRGQAGQAAIRRAVAWLEEHQNADGGWGEDLRSYDDPAAWSGRGASTASQTAWALLALLAAGERESAAVERGVRWLAQTQRPDGTWDEPQFTGTGFPRDFYLNYHLYRLAFPVSALGRYVRGSTHD